MSGSESKKKVPRRRPGRPAKPPRQAFSVRLPDDLYEAFSLGAWSVDRPMAELIEELVRGWVADHRDAIDAARAARQASAKRARRDEI